MLTMLARHPFVVLFLSVMTLATLTRCTLKTDADWSHEDGFCEALLAHKLTLCKCVVSEDNRLSLLCANTSEEIDPERELDETIHLAVQHSVTLSELTICDVEHLDVIRFEPGMAIDSLLLVNLSRLRQIEAPESGIQKLVATNSPQLELSSLFQFVRNQSQLHTTHLSDLNLISLRSAHSTPLATGHCLPMQQLSLNYLCNPTPAPIATLPRGVLSDLCQIRLLDLSCLGITELESGALPGPYHSEPVHIELGWNRLTSIESIFIRPPATINLDCNPLEKAHFTQAKFMVNQIRFEYHSC